MANSATAIAYSVLKPLLQWSPSDLDKVLLVGERYFLQCLGHLPVMPNYLNIEELLPYVTINEHTFNFQILPDVVVGVINPVAPERVLEGYFTNIQSGVEHFFQVMNMVL